jgi:hypothetical protein
MVAIYSDYRKGNIKNYAVKSVGSMTINTPFRAACLAIVEHWLFESFIIFIIICNSILLAYQDPTVVYEGR